MTVLYPPIDAALACFELGFGASYTRFDWKVFAEIYVCNSVLGAVVILNIYTPEIIHCITTFSTQIVSRQQHYNTAGSLSYLMSIDLEALAFLGPGNITTIQIERRL